MRRRCGDGSRRTAAASSTSDISTSGAGAERGRGSASTFRYLREPAGFAEAPRRPPGGAAPIRTGAAPIPEHSAFAGPLSLHQGQPSVAPPVHLEAVPTSRRGRSAWGASSLGPLQNAPEPSSLGDLFLSPAAAGLWEVGNPGTGGIVQRHYDENRERLTSFARGGCLCLKSNV